MAAPMPRLAPVTSAPFPDKYITSAPCIRRGPRASAFFSGPLSVPSCPLAVDRSHERLGVALAHGDSFAGDLVYAPQVFTGKRHTRGPRDLPDPLDQLQVLAEVLALEARRGAPEVVLEVVGTLDPTRQEAATQGRIGDEADAELSNGRQYLLLHMPSPQAVLGLQGSEGMHRMRSPYRLGCRLRDAEVAHLACLHQLRHGAPRLLDRSVGVHPVLVVEVDVVHTEAPQGSLASPPHVLGLAVDAQPRAIFLSLVAELGGEGDIVTPVGDSLTEELLVGEWTVGVSGVEEGYSELYGAMDGGDRLVLV